MRFVAYCWRIFVNVIYVIIILGVFSALQTPFEHIVVSAIGLTYAAIRGMAIQRALALGPVILNFDSDLVAIRRLLGDDGLEMRIQENQDAREVWPITRVKLWIDAVFLSIISLLCILVILPHVKFS